MAKPRCCERCPFYNHTQVDFVLPPQAKIALIGDSPWKTEVRKNAPFVGPAGQMLDACLEEVPVDRSTVAILNAVACQPEALGVPYPAGVVELCTRNILRPALEKLRPEVLVPMGNAAVKALIPKERGNISKIRGTARTIEFFGTQYTVIPTFHPSFLLRSPAQGVYVVSDLRFALGKAIPQQGEMHYRHVNTQERLERFWQVADQATVYAFDIETTSLDYRDAEVISLNFAFNEKEAYVITLFHEDQRVNTATYTLSFAKRLYRYLHNPQKRVFGHNLKFDLRIMDRWFKGMGGPGVHIDRVRWYDTMGMTGLLDENMRQRLKDVAPLYTDIRYTREELEDIKGGKAKKMPHKKLVLYGAKDAISTYRIGRLFARKLQEQGLWYGPFLGKDYSDMPVASTLFNMEIFGAPMHRTKMLALRAMVEAKLQDFHQQMQREARMTFNPRSTPQLADVMYNRMHYSTDVRTASGKPSTDKNALDALLIENPDDRFLIALHYFRQYDAIFKTFIKGLELRLASDGRLHPDFSWSNVVSGRVVCRNPNLANIPRDKEFEQGVLFSVREMFTARPGWVVIAADYSQIEYRCAALLSGDQDMIDALFLRGEDFHAMIARSAFANYAKAEAFIKKYATDQSMAQRVDSAKIKLKDWRVDAKKFNFASIFGAQDETLAKNLGVQESVVEEIIANIAARYPRFWHWVRHVGEEALQAGELRSAFGRVRRFPVTLDERVTGEQERQAMNFGPQTTAAYVGRGALVRIARRCQQEGLCGYPFNVVYDEILLECPEHEQEACRTIMGEEMLRPVPELDNRVFAIELGVGESWKGAESQAEKFFSVHDL